jgi:hypothetical protein
MSFSASSGSFATLTAMRWPLSLDVPPSACASPGRASGPSSGSLLGGWETGYAEGRPGRAGQRDLVWIRSQYLPRRILVMPYTGDLELAVIGRLAPLWFERLYRCRMGWRRSQSAHSVLGFSLVPRTRPGEGLECPTYLTTCTVLTWYTVPLSWSCAARLNGCRGS